VPHCRRGQNASLHRRKCHGPRARTRRARYRSTHCEKTPILIRERPLPSSPTCHARPITALPAASELLEERLGEGAREPRAVGLDGERLDLPVLDDGAEALRADIAELRAEVDVEAERLHKGRGRVREDADLAARLVLHAPGGGNEGVVARRDADDLIDALGLDRVRLLDEAGEVRLRAACARARGGEGGGGE
jgi:hypothetical protein